MNISLADNSASIAVSDERDLGAFIPSQLDDFGLDPYQFRVYCRLARRAGSSSSCWESINNIAKACKMNRKTVMQSIITLLSFGMLRQEKRPGKSDLYKLTSSKFWNQSARVTSPPDGQVLDKIPVRVTDTTSPPDGQHQSATGTTPVRVTDTKVFPEVTPTSYSQELVGGKLPPTVAPLESAPTAVVLEEVEPELTEQDIGNILDEAAEGICPPLSAIKPMLCSIQSQRLKILVDDNPEWGINLADYPIGDSVVMERIKLRSQRKEKLNCYALLREHPPAEYLKECCSDPGLKATIIKLAKSHGWSVPHTPH